MSIGILAALLLQSLPAPATAPWEPLGTPRGGVTNAVDPASIVRTGDNVAIRMRSVRAPADPEGNTTAVIGFTIDCRGRTATLEGVDLYKADGSFNRSIAGDDPRPVGSDPDQRALFERACRAPAAPAAAAPASEPAPAS